MAKKRTPQQQEAYDEGLREGRLELQKWLEDKYLAKDAPDRGTPEAEAILSLAREAGHHYRKLVTK